MDARFEQINATMNGRFEHVNQRFEVVEGVLREMSEQMVMQSRGIKVAIEARTNIEQREHGPQLSLAASPMSASDSA